MVEYVEGGGCSELRLNVGAETAKEGVSTVTDVERAGSLLLSCRAFFNREPSDSYVSFPFNGLLCLWSLYRP